MQRSGIGMNVIRQFPAVHDYGGDLRFQAMFEGAAIGIGICRLDGRILEANPALSRMLGYSQQELRGTDVGEFYAERRFEISRECLRPRDPGNLSHERLLDELVRGERDRFEIDKRCRRKDGSEFCGHLTLSLARGARQQPAFLIAMLADATEHKRLEEHLREAEKMEVIGRLAGGIAHDFNNLLTGILLYCDLLSAGLEKGILESNGAMSLSSGKRETADAALSNGDASRPSPPALGADLRASEARALWQHVEEVRMAGEQGAALTQQLLAVARKQAAEPRPIPINEIVTSTKNLLQRLGGEQIELVTELDSGAGQVFADPAQLRQILMNLVLNARDAMAQSGKIRLSTRAAELSREFSGEAEAGSARRAVSLVVKDNGCGMNAETRARLFEPFFT